MSSAASSTTTPTSIHDGSFEAASSTAVNGSTTTTQVESDGRIDMDSDSHEGGENPKRCPHIDAAFSVETMRTSMLRKYKSAVAWGASNSGAIVSARSGTRPTKRRKVCSYVHCPLESST